MITTLERLRTTGLIHSCCLIVWFEFFEILSSVAQVSLELEPSASASQVLLCAMVWKIMFFVFHIMFLDICSFSYPLCLLRLPMLPPAPMYWLYFVIDSSYYYKHLRKNLVLGATMVLGT